jgi:DNA-binding response OmpR family regulator
VTRNKVALRRLQLLFVDSDPQLYGKVQQVLGSEFEIQVLSSISEAIAALNVDLPDMLIAEVFVGQEDGLDLCRYVRANANLRQLPIMLLTSRSTLQDKIAGFAAGADDYVVKPFDARHLQARIRLLARIKRIERRLQV